MAEARAVLDDPSDTANATSSPTTRRYSHVLTALREPWAIQREMLDTIVEIVRVRANGDRPSDTEIRARLAGSDPPPVSRTVGPVAVIPVFGVIAHRMNMMTSISGGTSTEELAKEIRAALNDASVKAIVFDVDSPGGSVQGIEELANQIYQARSVKPIFAVANATAASAAYWIASQADQLFVTPSGQVGSIGVLAMHEDFSKQADMLGVKTTYISSTDAPYKTEGQPFAPLSDEARQELQKRVDEYHSIFRAAVARGRGVDEATVDNKFGGGRVLSAAAAKMAGMVDGVESLDAVLARLGAQQSRSGASVQAALPETAPARAGGADMADSNPTAVAETPVRDGEIIVSLSEIHQLRAKAARVDELEPLRKSLEESQAREQTITAEKMDREIRFKLVSLKIPAFRPYAKIFYELAMQAVGSPTFNLTGDPQQKLTAVQVVDAFIADMNRQAETLFKTLSINERPQVFDANEPTDPKEKVDYRAKKYQREHPGTDYKAALQTVLEADPDLKTEYNAA